MHLAFEGHYSTHYALFWSQLLLQKEKGKLRAPVFSRVSEAEEQGTTAVTLRRGGSGGSPATFSLPGAGAWSFMHERRMHPHMEEEQPEVCMTPRGCGSQRLGWAGDPGTGLRLRQPSDYCRRPAQRWQQDQKNMAGRRPGREPSRGPGGKVREGTGVLLSTTRPAQLAAHQPQASG